ncbi:MAG: ATP-binding protein [Nibricoccus sp.]
MGLWQLALYFMVGGGVISVGWYCIAGCLMVVLPAHTWIVKDVICFEDSPSAQRLWRARVWLVFAAAMLVWVMSQKAAAGSVMWLLGISGLSLLVFLGMSVAALQGMRGIQRMETQVLFLGAIAGSVIALLFFAGGLWLSEPVFLELMPVFVAMVCMGTCWALTSRRVLDARHILTSALERLVLVVAVVLFVWAMQQLGEQFVHPGTAYVLSLSTGLWFAAELHPWLRSFFRQKSRLAQLRRVILDVSGQQLPPEGMEDAFVKALKEHTHAERVIVMMGAQSRLVGGGLDLAMDSPVVKALQTLRWLTPERLLRQNGIVSAGVLGAFMREHQFSLVIVNSGRALSFLLGFGEQHTQRPFTGPEITRLIDIATTMENALSRARYLKQAQHAEQLATVGMLGASIAHEIRNPLVSIKTFVQLLPDHYQEQAFRDKFFRLIGDEVGRIDRLTEQLLDLSAPRKFSTQPVALHELLTSCVVLVAAKAEDKRVQLMTELNALPDTVETDPNALKQVLLNLCFNGIQALEHQSGVRWIKLKTTKAIDHVEVIVEDNGPGIAPETWSRLFQPFQSTKSSGFGLGLAICKDILFSIHASISADPPAPGRGATFRINLPCPPPSS